MQCSKPVDLGSRYVPCNTCVPCRINRRRAWTFRLMMERVTCLGDVSFVTLTYQPETVPTDDQGRHVLRKEDAQKWLKRLRKAVTQRTGQKVRYSLVGEYGPKTWRPHYHALLYGPDTGLVDGLTAQTWKHGFTSVQAAIPAHMRYVAAYTVKKHTHKDHAKLDGRPPEFAHYSRDPAVGTLAVRMLARALTTSSGSMVLARTLADYGDIPRFARHEGRYYPLDRTMLKHMRDELGVPQLAADRPEGKLSGTTQWFQTPEDLNDLWRKGEREARRLRAYRPQL